MTAPIDNGGPAFPTIGNIAHNSDWLSDDGMTLRDWFAGQALAYSMDVATEVGRDADPAALCASIAYGIADAMIAARKGDAA